MLRLRRAVHLRDVQGLPALLPSDHLEHESQHLQGRLGYRGQSVSSTLISHFALLSRPCLSCRVKPDPMKPMLDRMVDRVVASLSGEARSFYDREFTFFNEVTDISGKLKPFIKKTKPEKKVRLACASSRIIVEADR
jgi:hypothetical protein